MLHKTPGMVLNYIKYGETSIITRIFTLLFGQQTYIIHGVRSKKPKYSMALFQPLMPLDMVVYHKKTVNIQRIADVRCHTPIHGILGNLKKATVASFLSELLSKVLYEEEQNEALFNFLLQSVIQFNDQSAGYETFHLAFMLQLSPYLGFGVKTAQDMDIQLSRGGFHPRWHSDEIHSLDNLLHTPIGQAVSTTLPKATIRKLTTDIIHYYQLHVDQFDIPKSLKVLQELSN
ncbi:MAG: DNA repair protein RecO [Burkholderiales bacterium]